MASSELLRAPDGRAPEPSDAQKATAVWRHPDRDTILALLPKRTSAWIASYLAEQYPVEDEDGEPLPDGEARRNARRALSARSIEAYRRDYAYELLGVSDALPPGLEDLVGYRPPRQSARPEIELMEALVPVYLHNLQASMANDEQLGMLNPTTLEAQKQVRQLAIDTLEAKSKLGMDGYQAAPQEIHVEQNTRSVNVELHGRTDPTTGAQLPVDRDKVSALQEVLARGPAEAQAMVRAARDRADDVVDGTAA